MTDRFQVPSTVSRITTMADNTVRLIIDCQEIPPDQESKIFALRNKLGWFIFSEQPVKEEYVKDLPEIAVDKNEKTPGQRLRAVLYLYWNQHKSTHSFDDFYRLHMEKFIDSVKEKLDK
ncbi:MAG: hypothetical protein QME51_08610 [Planctomycetota bacterium]|nr:hypothetical protein [Planctomycetota bacterium]